MTGNITPGNSVLLKDIKSSYDKPWNNKLDLVHNFINGYIFPKYKSELMYLPSTDLYLEYFRNGFINEHVLYFLAPERKIKIPIIDPRFKNTCSFYINKLRKSKKRWHLFNGLQRVPVNLHNYNEFAHHSIAILYDSHKGTVDILNANENAYVFFQFYDKQLKKFFKTVYNKNVKIDHNLQCVKLETVFLQADCVKYNKNKASKFFILEGPCIIFALWLLDLRLKYQNKTKKQVIDFILKTLKENPKLLCEILLGYAQFINQIARGSLKYSNSETKLKRNRK